MSTNKEYLKILWSLVIFSALFVASYARADMKDLIFISKGAIPIEKLEDVSKKAIFIGRQNLPFVFKKDILKDGLNLVDLFNVFNLDFLAKRESRKIRLDLPAADYFLITPNNTFDSYINVSVKDNSLLIKNKAREFESLSDIFQPVAFEEDRTDNLPSNLCRTNKSRPDQETISQVSAGQFKLRAKNELVCYNKWFETKGNVMKVSFEYKHLTGDNPKFTIWAKSVDGSLNKEVYSEDLETTSGWTKFEKLIEVPEDKKNNIGIYLYSFSKGNYLTENSYKGIKIELFNWPLAERIFLAPEKFFNDDQNKYEVKQINFSKYKIKITDIDEPFLLNFLESFDNYWRLYARNGFSKKRLTDHFMINGYANGFIIDPKILEEKGILEMKENGKYDLELVMEYFPQRLFYLALLVSLLALFFSAFIVRKMKNEKA